MINQTIAENIVKIIVEQILAQHIYNEKLDDPENEFYLANKNGNLVIVQDHRNVSGCFYFASVDTFVARMEEFHEKTFKAKFDLEDIEKTIMVFLYDINHTGSGELFIAYFDGTEENVDELIAEFKRIN